MCFKAPRLPNHSNWGTEGLNALTFPQKWPEKRCWLHFTQVQCIQRKTAKSRGSPFLCCLEFPSRLWKWIKFMSSMKESKSSSSLAKEALILFLLQFSSARTAFIRWILHMHFLSRTSLGENQDITSSIVMTIYLKYRKQQRFPFIIFFTRRLFPGVHGTYLSTSITSPYHVTFRYSNALIFSVCYSSSTCPPHHSWHHRHVTYPYHLIFTWDFTFNRCTCGMNFV